MSTIFNPSDLIAEAIAAGYDHGVVSEFDDKQLPWAPNIFSWVTEPEFLNLKTLYPIQLQVMLRLFGDVCPYCSDWEFYSKDFKPDIPLGNVLDRIQLLHDGKCLKCHKTRIDHYHDGFWRFPNEIDLLFGMRSGKSVLGGGLVGSYVLHRYLRLPDPAGHFSLISGQELYMRFVAKTKQQAKQSNWMHFVTQVRGSSWFQQYHDFMNYHSKKKGIEYVKWQVEGFVYVHKGIAGYLVGAGTETNEKGRTSIFTSIDEIGMMEGEEDAKQYNPVEIYAAYEKASATIRPVASKLFLNGDYNVPTAWMAVHSSSKSKTDFMMRLVKQNINDPKKVVAHKATWEVNPTMPFDTEELQSELKKDPKIFWRDYGSLPPFANDPFIESQELVFKTAIIAKPQWNISVQESQRGLYLDASSIEVNKSIPYCLAVDMGRTDNGYGVALLKLKEDDFTTVQIEGLWSIYPKKPQVVDLDAMFNDFISVLCDKLNVQLVLYDQWQSGTQTDALSKRGVKSFDYSLTYKDFLNFRSQLYQGKLETITPEMPFEDAEKSVGDVMALLEERPYLHLLWQLLSVSEIGNKITKGTGNDDLFRAVVLGCTKLWDERIRPQFEYKGGIPLWRSVQKTSSLVVSGGSRGGGGMYMNRQTGSTHSSVNVGGRALGAFVGKTTRR